MRCVAFFRPTAMGQVRWAVALVGIFLSAHGHASPSFDCHKAIAPIDVLICAIPELAQLDGKLADAFQTDTQSARGASKAGLLAGERSWLLRRESDCQVPTKGAELRIEEWNMMADCVSRLYRERIAELRPRAVVPDIAAPSGGLLHPLCLDKVLRTMWNREPPAQESFSLKDCTAEYAEAPISISGGLISAHYINGAGYEEYKAASILPEGRQLLVVYDGGGSGHGSQVATISRANDNGEIVIHGGTVFMGADRCDGFIATATPNSTGVFVDLDVNPGSLLSFADPKKAVWGASHGYNDCIGTIRLRTSLRYDYGDGITAAEAVSGTVKLDTKGLRAADGNHCFDVAVSKIPGALPKTLDRVALRQLVKSYKTCFAKEQRDKP